MSELPDRLDHFIAGAWSPSADGATFAVTDPVGNRVYAQVAAGGPADVDRAARAAHCAFTDGPWPAMAARQRARVLNRIADGIEQRGARIAELETFDTGLPVTQAHGQAERAAENFRFFADMIVTAHEDAFRTGTSQLGYVIRKPAGPAGLITPWNTPFMLETWKLAPSLAAGCPVILKPAEWSPLSASLLPEIMTEAGVPDGVFNMVHGIGEVAGAALVTHPLVPRISFTGETATGQAIMAAAAPGLKGLSMELGGKSPCVVFADADLDAATDSALFGVFSLNGERCTAGSRILAERSVYDALVSRLADRAERIRVGPPSDPDTEVGALIHPDHYQRVLSYVQSGLDEGARLVAGGRRPANLPSGNYLAPTVFADVRPEMRIFREEIFGPVVCVTPFEDRGRRDPAGQRHPLRPGRLHLDAGSAPRPPGRRRRGRRDAVAELAQRARPAHPVRRGEGQRPRPRRRPAQPGLLYRLPHRARRPRGHQGSAVRHGRNVIMAAGTLPIGASGAGPPPPDIVRSVYAELVVTDLARARWFWVDVLGFVVTESGPGALYLRGYDELTHHNLILTEGAEPAAGRLAFRVRTPADLDLAVDFYTSLGCRTTRLPAGTTPGIGPAVRAEDPLGFTVEYFCEAATADRLQQRYDLRRGAEVARMDHFNIVVPDVQAAYEYYTSLGFGLSETIEDAQTLYAAWMFRKQTVHDVAFTGGAGPRLHHLGFFAHETHQVLRICDILGSLHSEGHIERGPGRHGVSNAFYVYLRDPDGHRVEIYTSDYYTGDPGHPVLRWDVSDPRRRSFYGHAVVPSWYAEASTVLDLDGQPRPVSDEHQILEYSVGADGFPVR